MHENRQIDQMAKTVTRKQWATVFSSSIFEGIRNELRMWQIINDLRWRIVILFAYTYAGYRFMQMFQNIEHFLLSLSLFLFLFLSVFLGCGFVHLHIHTQTNERKQINKYIHTLHIRYLVASLKLKASITHLYATVRVEEKRKTNVGKDWEMRGKKSLFLESDNNNNKKKKTTTTMKKRKKDRKEWKQMLVFTQTYLVWLFSYTRSFSSSFNRAEI